MKNKNSKPTHQELITLLKTPGWELEIGNNVSPVKKHTLEELVKTTHSRHTKRQNPGIIRRIENATELELVQLQLLWKYLGLPT